MAICLLLSLAACGENSATGRLPEDNEDTEYNASQSNGPADEAGSDAVEVEFDDTLEYLGYIYDSWLNMGTIYTALYKTADTYDVIVAGDYNSYPDTEAIAFMNNHPEKFVSTYSEMNQPFFLTHLTCDFDGCIDYIYTTQNKLEVSSVLPLYDDKTLHEISIEIPDKYHPSDHFPIAAALKFKL